MPAGHTHYVVQMVKKGAGGCAPIIGLSYYCTGEESPSVSRTVDAVGTMWLLSWLWNAGPAPYSLEDMSR